MLALFYEVNAHLLLGTADYVDLSAALHQAATNLGWNVSDTDNLHRACRAVEILPNYVGVNPAASPNGCRRPGISAGGPWPTLAAGVAAVRTGDPVFVLTGSYPERLTITKPVQLRTHNGPFTIGR